MASDDFQTKDDLYDDNVSDKNTDASNQMVSSKPTSTNQLQYISKMVIKQTISHKFAGPFLKPVNGKVYTDYYPMISKPMDLGTIKKRLNERWYSSAKQCISDFKQMFENCRTYNINKDDPVILQMNDTLEAYVMEKVSRMPAIEEAVQPAAKSKAPVKKVKVSAKVASKVLNGHDSPPTEPPSNPVPQSSPTTPHPLPQHPPQGPSSLVDAGKGVEVKVEGAEVRKSLKRKAESPAVAVVTELPVKRERSVKKVKYNETDDDTVAKQPSIPQQPPPPPPSNLSSSLSYCKKILFDMLQPPTSSRASYFYRPFDASLPQYHNFYQVVKRPIDLGFIESKFHTNCYHSSKEFADDMRLMFSNCYRFFPPDTDIVYAARYLQDIFELNFARIPESPPRSNKQATRTTRRSRLEEEEDEDDDDDDEEYLGKLDKLRESLEKLQSELARMTEEGRLSKENKQRRRQMRQQQQQYPQQLQQQQHYSQASHFQQQQQRQQYLQQHQQLYTTPHHNNQHSNKTPSHSQPHNSTESQFPSGAHVKNLQNTNFDNNNNYNQSTQQQQHPHFATSQHSTVTNNNNNNNNNNNKNNNNNNSNNSVPAMTSASEDDVTPMTFDEIKKLSDDIQNVPAKELFSMWMKLRSMEACLKDSDPDEIELDFSAFKPSTLRWLQAFAKPYQSHGGPDGGDGAGVSGRNSGRNSRSSVNTAGGSGNSGEKDGSKVDNQNLDLGGHSKDPFLHEPQHHSSNVADTKQQNVAFMPQQYPQQQQQPCYPLQQQHPQQLSSPQQYHNQFQKVASYNQAPQPNPLLSPNPFEPSDHKPSQRHKTPQQELFNNNNNLNQHQPQQHDPYNNHAQNIQENSSNQNQQQPYNNNDHQQLSVNNNNNASSQQQQPFTDQSNTSNQTATTNHGADSINKLLRNITEASSASNSPMQQQQQQYSRPPNNPPTTSTPVVSSVITNLIGSNGSKSSPFNQSEGSSTPGSAAANHKSNKDGGRLKSLGSWSSLAQISKNCEAVNISKKNSEQSFNLFKKQAEEKKERERQNREQEEQRRHRMEQFQHEKMKKEQEKQRAREEEEALAGVLTASSHPPSDLKANSGAASGSPANGSDESDARVLSQKEKNRLREQERRKRAARAGLIDMNAQSVLMADFEKDLKSS